MYMNYFLVVGAVVILFVVAAFFSVIPHYPRSSRFELERRRKNKSKDALKQLRRLEYHGDIVALLRWCISVVLILMALFYGMLAGWEGVLYCVIVVLIYPSLARLEPLKKLSMRYYNQHEEKIINFLSQKKHFRKFINPHRINHESIIESRHELEHLILSSHDVISHDERTMLLAGLDAKDKKVINCMTKRNEVKTVGHEELLGPLVLDDLHKSGHSQFPVIGQDIDHIIGMLYLPKLLRLEAKRSVRAISAMDKHIEYIDPETTLDHALQQILQSRQTLMVVVDADKKTLGVITIRDIVEALIGRNLHTKTD